MGKRILMTGMTGFFGYPFLTLLLHFKKLTFDDTPVYILSRDKVTAQARLGLGLELESICWINGDIESFDFHEPIDLIIHGASTSNFDKFTGATPFQRLSIIVNGTDNIIRIADRCGVSRVLFISSGSVYGNSTEIRYPLSENSSFGPNIIHDPESCYSEAKRFAELKLLLASNVMSFDVVIARCFAFIGPLLPLDLHFSVGNFINCAINNLPIILRSDGSAVRSYMYTYDLAIWLAAIIQKGRSSTAYNVGSDVQVSILELSYLVRDVLNPDLSIITSAASGESCNTSTSAPSFYVPSLDLAQSELGVSVWTSLRESIASASPSSF